MGSLPLSSRLNTHCLSGSYPRANHAFAKVSMPLVVDKATIHPRQSSAQKTRSHDRSKLEGSNDGQLKLDAVRNLNDC
eukprot:scaffold277018_cov20-Prasinocladus_malaysianus.AAC.1